MIRRLLLAAVAQDASRERPHIIVLTDIENEPDDAQSLVRFLLYSNQIDIEGLVATRNSRGLFPEQITAVINAYGEVRDNLERHEAGYPVRPTCWSGSRRDELRAGCRASADPVSADHNRRGLLRAGDQRPEKRPGRFSSTAATPS